VNNIILAVGDSGSAVNFIRNLITLSDNVHWPHDYLPRLDYIINTVYPGELKNNLNNWMGQEYKLRNWSNVYGIDVSHEPDTSILTPKVQECLKTQHVAFIVHWVRYAKKILNETNAATVVISPKSDFGLFWQIRAFVEKCGIDCVPNYTFNNNIEFQKKMFIDSQGLDCYRRTNTLNMYEIIKNRTSTYRELGQTHGITLNLEDLFDESTFITLVHNLNAHCDINIDIDRACIMRNAWWSLHWPLHKTRNFAWL
jgi:hypothetical protein